jgi:hypothetical protein
MSNTVKIFKLITAIFVALLAVSSLISAYHGNMETAIYTGMWAMWFELLGVLRDIQRSLKE